MNLTHTRTQTPAKKGKVSLEPVARLNIDRILTEVVATIPPPPKKKVKK